jgi:hypothetical protein
LSFTDDKDGRRRRKSDPDSSHSGNPSRSRKKRPTGEVGHALRSAYQRMVDEDIPPEMLDLLGKLG